MVTGRGTSLASKNSIAYGTSQPVITSHTRRDYYLANCEQIKQLVGEELVVAIIACNIRN
jgi:hypothetical protein